MDYFNSWWEKDENFQAKAPGCSNKPGCKKFPASVCERTFDNFMKSHESLIPKYEGQLLDRIKVVKTLGGGKSGAYLFVIKLVSFENDEFVEQVIESDEYVLKLYVNAYNSIGSVQDTRPFREVYTQCALSGTVGFNCLIGFGSAEWSSVSDMFGMTTNEIYNASLERIQTAADGRNISPTPSKVLFMISSFSNGIPLFNLNLKTHGYLLPGMFLNIMSIHQAAENRLGQFTHWDLHADNIFVDTECSSRSAIPLALISTFDPNYILNKYKASSDTRAAKTSFQLLWNVQARRVSAHLENCQKTGEFVDFTIYGITTSKKLTEMQQKAFSQLEADFNSFLKRAIHYPNVTLIDFDLAYSDQFPETEAVHLQKQHSRLPIAERTMTWLFKWIPAATAVRIIVLLGLVRTTLPERKQSDILHLMVYICVALIYWDLNAKDENMLLAALHERSYYVLNRLEGLLQTSANKVSFDGLKTFFTTALESSMVIQKCPGAFYCAISPSITVNYITLSSTLMNWTCPNPVEGSTQMLCQVTKTLQRISEKEKWEQLIKIIHTALLELNMRRFFNGDSKGTFLTLDSSILRLRHKASPHIYYADVEFIVSQKTWYVNLILSLLRIIGGPSFNGLFAFSLQFLQDTKIDIKLKNGAELFVDVNLNAVFRMYTTKTPVQPKAYKIHITTVPDPSRLLNFDVTLKRIIIKFGAVTEIEVHFSYAVHFARILNTIIETLISSKFKQLGADFKAAFIGGLYVIKCSLPPADEPIHPCIGLLMDHTNIQYGLDCASSVTSAPTVWSKMIKTMSESAKTFIPDILNQIDVQLGFDDFSMLTIWSLVWGREMQPTVVFGMPITRLILKSLTDYVTQYKLANGSKLEEKLKEGLQDPVLTKALDFVAAVRIPPELTRDTWSVLDVNMDNFNVKYVDYLLSFLPNDDNEV